MITATKETKFDYRKIGNYISFTGNDKHLEPELARIENIYVLDNKRTRYQLLLLSSKKTIICENHELYDLETNEKQILKLGFKKNIDHSKTINLAENENLHRSFYYFKKNLSPTKYHFENLIIFNAITTKHCITGYLISEKSKLEKIEETYEKSKEEFYKHYPSVIFLYQLFEILSERTNIMEELDIEDFLVNT